MYGQLQQQKKAPKPVPKGEPIHMSTLHHLFYVPSD